MKHTHHRRSDCPINFALEMFGHPWSLLLICDVVSFGKNTYGEFFVSEEGMATNILASRLAHKEKMIRLMRETVQSGGSVFAGEKSLLSQFMEVCST